MSNRKAIANFESTQVIGAIEKTATIISTTGSMLTACGHVTAFAHSETNLSWRPWYFVRQQSSTLARHQCVAADSVPSETVSLALFWLRGIIRGPTVI